MPPSFPPSLPPSCTNFFISLPTTLSLSPSHVTHTTHDTNATQDTADYPKRVQPNQLLVDMEKEVVFAPINGQPVPLSIHTIKNVTQPDPDNHWHYLRINFFTSGAVSRRAAKGWAGLGLEGLRIGFGFLGLGGVGSICFLCENSSLLRTSEVDLNGDCRGIDWILLPCHIFGDVICLVAAVL